MLDWNHSFRPGGRPAGITFTARIHDAYPVPAGELEPDLGPVTEAIALSNAARHGEQPYMLVFRLLHSANSEMMAGDVTRAVIDLNTAIETLVSITVNEGGPLVGLTEDDLVSANRPGVKRRVKKFLSRVFGEDEINVDDLSNPWGQWFDDGYRRRNEAVHEGGSLQKEDASRAFAQARAVVTEVKEKLESREELVSLGEQLVLDFSRETPESFEAKIMGISFPWD